VIDACPVLAVIGICPLADLKHCPETASAARGCDSRGVAASMELCRASAARAKTPAAAGGQRYNDEVMGREMAMARPGDMLFGRRTWQAFITALGRTPSLGKIPVRLLADLPVAQPFGG
jgi:hypothetical protein